MLATLTGSFLAAALGRRAVPISAACIGLSPGSAAGGWPIAAREPPQAGMIGNLGGSFDTNHLYSKNRDGMMGASTALVGLAALFWGLSGGIGAVLMANGWDPFVV